MGAAARVALLDEFVQRTQQSVRPITVAVEIDFGIQSRQVLEIAQRDGLGPADIHLCQMCANMIIVALQVVLRNSLHLLSAG